MKEKKQLFTLEAVNSALKICVLGSLGVANKEKLAEDIIALPEELRNIVLSNMLAGQVAFLKATTSPKAKEDFDKNLEKEVLEAINQSRKSEENNSKTN